VAEFMLAMGGDAQVAHRHHHVNIPQGGRRDPRPKPQTLSQTRFDVTPQSPYAPAVESLPPITGHSANSRQDSRAFNNALASFLFRKITVWVFAVPPFSPGSATHA